MSAGLTEWQVSKLVDDNEVITQELFGQTPTATSGLFLFELIDKIDKVEEASTGPGSDNACSHANAEMALAGASAPDKDGIALGVQKGSRGKLTQLVTIKEVQDYATDWLWTYNNDRPNMGLSGITPAQKLKLQLAA